jgi:hypothetical protein
MVAQKQDIALTLDCKSEIETIGQEFKRQLIRHFMENFCVLYTGESLAADYSFIFNSLIFSSSSAISFSSCTIAGGSSGWRFSPAS